MLNGILIIILITAILFVTIDVTKTYNSSPPPQTIYKFIPRSFAENQANPVPLDAIFGKMFNNATPWVASFGKDIKQHKINDFFVSQL